MFLTNSMDNLLNILQTKIAITRLLIQLEEMGKWDKENPWAKRASDGKFSKNNTSQSSKNLPVSIPSQLLTPALSAQLLNPISIENINNQTQQVFNDIMKSPAVKQIRDSLENLSKRLGKEAGDAYEKVSQKFDAIKSDLPKAIKNAQKEAEFVLKGARVRPGLAALGVIAALSGSTCIAAACLTHPMHILLNMSKPGQKKYSYLEYLAYTYFSEAAEALFSQSGDIFAELRDEGIRREIGKIKDLADEAGVARKAATKNALSKAGLDYEQVMKEVENQKSRNNTQREKIEDYESELLAAQERKTVAESVAATCLQNTTIQGVTPELMSELSKSTLDRANAVEEIEKLSAIIAQIKGDRFSLEKRVFELQDIVEQEGADSDRAKWRIGVIQSAVKYGEIVDRLGEDRNSSNNPDMDYELLINKLAKQNAPEGKFSTVSQKDSSMISSQFNAIGGGSITPTGMRPAFLELAKNELNNFQKLLNTPLNIQVDLSANRPFSATGANTKSGEIINRLAPGAYDQLDYFNQADGYINMGDTGAKYGLTGANMSGYDELADPVTHTREMVFHEAGHILEMKQGMVSTSAAFREDRANETPPDKQIPLPAGVGGMNGQTDAALDRFLNPYQGLRLKMGNEEISTEVVSSGFEALGSPHLASRMAQADPETLLYALSVADKSYKK